jgi:lysophospholipase L1-like esterase
MKKYSDKILVIGLTTVHPDTDEVYVKDFVYKRDRITEYDQILHKVAAEHSLAVVDVVSSLKGKPDMFFRDNIHLSDKGHETIVGLVLPELNKLLSI